MKVSLNQLANELAVTDKKSGIDLTAAHVKAVLAALGDRLRKENTAAAFAIVQAIAERAGTSKS